MLTPEEKAAFAVPADPIIPDSAPVYDTTPVPAAALFGDEGNIIDFAGYDYEPVVPFEAIDEQEIALEVYVKRVTSHSMFGASPFSLGLSHPRVSSRVCRALMKKLENALAGECKKEWFRHMRPTPLVMDGLELRAMSDRSCSFSVDVVNGIVRLFMYLDKQMYLISEHWRTFGGISCQRHLRLQWLMGKTI